MPLHIMSFFPILTFTIVLTIINMIIIIFNFVINIRRMLLSAV